VLLATRMRMPTKAAKENMAATPKTGMAHAGTALDSLGAAALTDLSAYRRPRPKAFLGGAQMLQHCLAVHLPFVHARFSLSAGTLPMSAGQV